MSDPPGFVGDYLLFLLAATSDAASAEFHTRVRSAGLRVPEWRTLSCLLDQDGSMITRLADLALMEQSRLTRIIDQMAMKGWVERRTDASDRRRVRIWLTTAGRDLAEDLVGQARAHEAVLMRDIDPQAALALKPALKALRARLGRPVVTDD